MAYTKNIVTTVSYMIGIRKNIVENIAEENTELLHSLCNNKNCKIIRYLCKLRTALMLNFKKTDIEMKNNLTNIDKLKWFDHDNIQQLEQWNIKIVKANGSSSQYMEIINKYISDNISNCKNLFPEWVNWDYIKDLLLFPVLHRKKS